jgi:hypothetical protein
MSSEDGPSEKKVKKYLISQFNKADPTAKAISV